jgi:hypothetical protein
MKRMILIISIFFIVSAFIVESLSAIPAFARKYKMSCKTCHAPYPRLKPYGYEFAANGFTIPEQETARYFVDTGDDKLSLIRDFPFAIRMDGFIQYNNSKSEVTDFSAPYNIKLLSGGSLAKNISYYFYFFFSERGKIVGLEDAFLMFTNIFKSGITLSVGQFQVSDPLFKRELRLTYEDYHIYKAAAGGSVVDLTYDRGIMFNYAIPKGPDLVLEILNGTGIEEANIFKNFDNDKYKNVFGRISQGIGDIVRVGAFGYLGKEAPDGIVNKIRMVGGDATVTFSDSMELNFQYMERNDDNPYFSASSPLEIRTRGGFAELVINPGGSDALLYGVGLFNWVDSEEDTLDYQSVAAHIGYLIRRNVRLMGEFNYIFKGPYDKHARVILGLIAAF